MRNLRTDIIERLLGHIERPGQYCGLEHNRRCGDVDAAEVTVALAFPDAYGLGISHLGTQILYTLLNGMEGIACDRCYCPAPDAEAVMRAEKIPLFAWESRAAVADFDIVGFSLSYELTLTNVLTMLDLAGIPLAAEERTDAHPLVIAGGTMADVPEVMADFIDVFLVGDGERALAELVELLRKLKRSGAGRADMLLEAARRIPSAYVPALWRVEYAADGTLATLTPTRDDLPRTVTRGVVDLADSPAITHPLVPAAEAVFERVSIEVMRGCPHACRFCHAGATKKPVRRRGVEEIVQTAAAAVANTGLSEVSLLSLSTGDYPGLGELMRRLNERFESQNVSIAVPSLRVDEHLADLPWQLARVRKGAMTIAAEAGSDRLRRAMRKAITNEDLLAGVRAAYAAGWKSVKVYFMAGFPGEREQDISDIFELCRELSAARRSVNGHTGGVTASVSWLVPKAHTPLQWAAQAPSEYFSEVRARLSGRARRTPIQFKFHRAERSALEGVIARGDRRVGRVIRRAWELGARFDGWDEHFRVEKWQQAFDETGLDPDFYARRQRPIEELLPWSPIRGHCSAETLAAEWRDYLQQMGAM